MAASTDRVLRKYHKRAKDFPNSDALNKYLKDHPDADKTKHKVVKEDPAAKKLEPAKPPQPKKPEEAKRSQPPPIPEDAKRKTQPPPVPGQTKKQPPPIPEAAKKKPSQPPPIPEDAKKKQEPKKEPAKPPPLPKKKPEAPEAKEEAKPDPEAAKPGNTWKQRFKNLSEGASQFASELPKKTRHFLGDDDFRREALGEAKNKIVRGGKKMAENLVETAKHEVHEFKEAGQGIKKVIKGGKMSPKEKKAFKAVSTHMTIAVAAASLGAASPLAGVGLFAEGLAKHVALKSVHRSLAKMHTLEELGHIGHGIMHLMEHIAAKGGKKEKISTDELMAKYIMACVAKELDSLTDEDLQQVLESMDAGDAKKDKDAAEEGSDQESEDNSGDDSEDEEPSKQDKTASARRVVTAYLNHCVQDDELPEPPTSPWPNFYGPCPRCLSAEASGPFGECYRERSKTGNTHCGTCDYAGPHHEWIG